MTEYLASPYTFLMSDKIGNTIRDLYAKGVDAFDRRNYDEAKRHLEEVDSLNPRFADVLNRLGIIANLESRLKDAVEYFQRAFAINPNYTEAALNLTITYNELGETDKAYEIFNRISKGTPASGGALDPYAAGRLANEHFRVGSIYLQFSMFDEAIEEFRKALKLKSGLADVHTKLGVALREKGRHEEAAAELQKAVEANPKYGPAWVHLGLAYFQLGLAEEAQSAWQRGLSEVPGLNEAKTLLKLFESGGQ